MKTAISDRFMENFVEMSTTENKETLKIKMGKQFHLENKKFNIYNMHIRCLFCRLRETKRRALSSQIWEESIYMVKKELKTVLLFFHLCPEVWLIGGNPRNMIYRHKMGAFSYNSLWFFCLSWFLFIAKRRQEENFPELIIILPRLFKVKDPSLMNLSGRILAIFSIIDSWVDWYIPL